MFTDDIAVVREALWVARDRSVLANGVVPQIVTDAPAALDRIEREYTFALLNKARTEARLGEAEGKLAEIALWCSHTAYSGEYCPSSVARTYLLAREREDA